MTSEEIQSSLEAAIDHHKAGRLAKAEAIYQQILAQDRNHLAVIHYLAALAHQSGRNTMAIELFRRAIALKPDWPEAHSNLAHILMLENQYPEAIAAACRAIELKPDYAEAHNNLGNALQGNKNFAEAILACRRAIVLRPDFAEAYNNLGNALRASAQPAEAIAAYQQAIAINSHFAEAYNNLGNALQDQRQHAAGADAYRRAIALRPNYAKAQCNLANALKDDGKPDEAIAAFRNVIALQPDLAEAHANLALVLLSIGNYEQGWEEYEWRRKCSALSIARTEFTAPEWTGESLTHRRLLLHTEQGLGDAIQFARFIPPLIPRAAKIILQCQPPLARLMQMSFPECEIVIQGQPLPAFDYHVPLLSLPRILQTTLATIPCDIPYLKPDSSLNAAWEKGLGPRDGKLHVGITWAGNPNFPGDQTRSLHIDQLKPLARIPGIQLFSLQKGVPAEQIKHVPPGLKLIDLSAELTDFADTAAAMSQLDLIITTDTSIPHLAGALGKPAWLMLQAYPDWRWLRERADSPWYPSIRLFRQTQPGDWATVLARVATELVQRVESAQ